MTTLSKRNLSTTLLLAAALLGTQADAGNKHYRWLNSEGESVYSDRPPPVGTDYEVVDSASGLQRGGPDAATQAGANTTAGGAAVGEAPAAGQQDAQLCEQAQGNLSILTGTGIVTVRDAKDQPRELSKQEIAIQIETTRAQISAYCEPEE